MLFSGNLLRHPCFDEMRKAKDNYHVVESLENMDRIMSDNIWIDVYPGMMEEMLNGEGMRKAVEK